MMEGPAEHRVHKDPAANQGEVIVSFEHVSKKFCRSLKRSMAYGLLDLSRNFVGLKAKDSDLRRGEFWALKDLSFDLMRGEAFGVLGLNGSGKTTLMRLLGGIFPPDKGEIMIKGRVGVLISMGAGFHPHMTGRENIYVNGSVLGMTREELNARFESIVDFAEIGDFLDAPISTYSNGMRIRLGFAIATCVIPDILLLDEVFAVGDIVFRQRALERILHIISHAAVIITSNRPEYIEMLCSRALWLDRGEIVAQGSAEEVAAQYAEETSRRSALFTMKTGASREGPGDIRFTDDVQVYGSASGANEIAIRGEELIVEAPFVCKKPWSQVRFCIEILDLVLGRPLTTAEFDVDEVTADGLLRCTFYKLPLGPRSYGVTLKIMHADTALDIWRYATHITALRTAPRPSQKPKKYPHEITVDTDGITYEHYHERPKKDEASLSA